MQRKAWYSIFRVDAMPLSLKNLLLNLTYKFLWWQGNHKGKSWDSIEGWWFGDFKIFLQPFFAFEQFDKTFLHFCNFFFQVASFFGNLWVEIKKCIYWNPLSIPLKWIATVATLLTYLSILRYVSKAKIQNTKVQTNQKVLGISLLNTKYFLRRFFLDCSINCYFGFLNNLITTVWGDWTISNFNF